MILFGGRISLAESQVVLPAGDMELRFLLWSLVLSPGRWIGYQSLVTFVFLDPKFSVFVLFFSFVKFSVKDELPFRDMLG